MTQIRTSRPTASPKSAPVSAISPTTYDDVNRASPAASTSPPRLSCETPPLSISPTSPSPSHSPVSPPDPWIIPDPTNPEELYKRINILFDKLQQWAEPALEIRTEVLSRLATVTDPPSHRLAKGIVQGISMALCVGACRKMLRAILKKKSRKQGRSRLSSFLRNSDHPAKDDIINTTVAHFTAFWTELKREMPSTEVLEDCLQEFMSIYVWIALNEFTLCLAPSSKHVWAHIMKCIPGIAPVVGHILEGRPAIDDAKRCNDIHGTVSSRCCC